jgi:hypothetical protein
METHPVLTPFFGLNVKRTEVEITANEGESLQQTHTRLREALKKGNNDVPQSLIPLRHLSFGNSVSLNSQP